MNEIPGIGPIQGPGGIEKRSGRVPPPSSKGEAKAAGDSVQISEAAQAKAALDRVPEVRADRITEIRGQIKAGTYLTDEKINRAIDRLLLDLF